MGHWFTDDDIDLEGAPGEKVREAVLFGDAQSRKDVRSIAPVSSEPTSPALPVDSRIRTQLHESTVQSMREATLFEDEGPPPSPPPPSRKRSNRRQGQ